MYCITHRTSKIRSIQTVNTVKFVAGCNQVGFNAFPFISSIRSILQPFQRLSGFNSNKNYGEQVLMIRLDWIRLDWVRLDWIRLDWVRLDWIRLDRVRLD